MPALGSGEGRREESDAGTLDEENEEGENGEASANVDNLAEPEADEVSPAPRFDDLTARQRRRYEIWCQRLAELAPQLPFAGRLVALRLILDAVRGELFPRRHQWLPLVAASTQALGATGEAFDEERSRAASLGAVALAALRGSLLRYAEWEELRFPYERAVDAVMPLLVDTDPDAVERYAAPLEAFFGPAVQPAAVEALVDSLLRPDLIADAIRLAEHHLGLSAERRGNVIELNDPIDGDPRRTLLAVISLCEKAEVAVTTPSWAAHQALAVWRAPNLVIVTRNQAGVRGVLYELRGFGPGTYKDDVQSLPRPKARWASDEQTPAEAATLIAEIAVP